MILSLRHRHRRMFAVLGVLLPIAFAASIAARKAVPTVVALPPGLVASTYNFATTEPQQWIRFEKAQIVGHLRRESWNAGRFGVAFMAPPGFAKPDLIVYWIAGNPSLKETLPENATLLGTFSSPTLVLPEEATQSDGILVLYSLANHEVVDVSEPARFNGSTE